LRLAPLDAGTPGEARGERRHDVATQQGPTIGEEARNAISRILLEKVRQDKYPSVTQMEMIEQLMPPYLLRDYINVLLEKVVLDSRPSIPLMRRIAKISQQL
jgi:hypothetical protein